MVANLAHRYVEDTEWEYSEFSLDDLGEAVAHMTLQAQALGLAARQFRAFDRAAVAAAFDVPPHWEVTTMAAFGRPASPGAPSPTPSSSSDEDAMSRQRRASSELLGPGLNAGAA